MEEIEIRIRQLIDRDWSDWLDGMSILHTECGETIVTGFVRDQAALRGLVDRVADLGVELSSLVSRRVDMPGEVRTM
jgi:hypothetical protein